VLFRSVQYQRDESELLVVVTAHLVRPISPHDAPRLPTDNELNDPNDIQLFLFGSMGGGGSASSGRSDQSKNDGGGVRTASRTGITLTNRGPSGELGFIR